MHGKINYIVISLDINEVKQILDKISESETEYHIVLSSCLNKNMKNYGETVDHWKPFGEKSIKELLKKQNDKKRNKFVSHSVIMKKEHPPRVLVKKFLDANINVIFIDPFALVLLENKELLIRIIAMVAKGNQCLSCTFTVDNQVIKKETKRILENIEEYYESGIKHQKIREKSDFFNFINDTSIIPHEPGSMDKENNELVEWKALPGLSEKAI